MREKTPTKVRIPALNAIFFLAGLALLTGCASTTGTSEKGDYGNPWLVTISFKTGSECEIDNVTPEPNACALTDRTDICVKQGKYIRWVSAPAKTGFRIYFDPIVGASVNASGGSARRQIDKKAPAVLYKYTIMGSSSECSIDNPAHVYDPHIRVDK